MNELVGMMEGILGSFGEVHAADLARSPQWLAVRERYLWASSRLLVNGHDALVLRVDREYANVRNALGAAGERGNGKLAGEDYALWDAATEFLLTLRALQQFDGKIESLSQVTAPAEMPAAFGRKVAQSKRSWTQPELDEAIREYQAKRSARYQELVGILDDPATPEGRKRAARLAAQRLFGRNVIAKELGVKAAKMVSQSAAWVAIAEALDLPRKGSRKGAPAGGQPAGKRTGLDMAVEKASVDAPETATYAPADAALLRAEREESLRQIRRLAESRVPQAKSFAKAIFEKYESGEVTDEQVRETVTMMLKPAAG